MCVRTLQGRVVVLHCALDHNKMFFSLLLWKSDVFRNSSSAEALRHVSLEVNLTQWTVRVLQLLRVVLKRKHYQVAIVRKKRNRVDLYLKDSTAYWRPERLTGLLCVKQTKSLAKAWIIMTIHHSPLVLPYYVHPHLSQYFPTDIDWLMTFCLLELLHYINQCLLWVHLIANPWSLQYTVN